MILIYKNYFKLLLEIDESLLTEEQKNKALEAMATALIANKAYSRKFGARNMRRYIQKEVEDRLAELIIADYRRFYSFAKIDSDGETLSIHCM